MKHMAYWKAMLLTTAGLAVVLAVFEFGSLDTTVQDHFYNFDAHRWWLEESDVVIRAIFYHGMKVSIIVLCVVCAVGCALSYRIGKLVPARRAMAIMALSIIFVPVVTGGIKQISNVYTPRQVERYGGQYPYMKAFAPYPDDFVQEKRGRGYPAAHASAGLALMGAYFAFRRRRWRIAGLVAGLVIGWLMGLYQTFAGQHYLSHTFVSMLLTWMIVLTIDRLLPPEECIPKSSSGTDLKTN